jgi:ABC-type sulfate transport system permease component
MPLAVYLALQTDLEAAVALSVLLVLVSLLLMLLLGRTPFSPAARSGPARPSR